jgi:hypothetical protein
MNPKDEKPREQNPKDQNPNSKIKEKVQFDKKRSFVRPNCSKIWCFQCIVCGKRDYRFNAHPECYRKWCDMCQISFATEEKMTEHANKFHAKNWCQVCNQVFESLKTHRAMYSNCNNKNPDEK